MAAYERSTICSLLFLCSVLHNTLCLNDGYYAYTVGKRKTPAYSEVRFRRYVESAIDRLADNYKSNMKLYKNTQSNSRMDLVGNVAIREPKQVENQTETVTPSPLSTSTTTEKDEMNCNGEACDSAYPTEASNKTLQNHNITSEKIDQHQYYNSTFIVDSEIGSQYWVNMDDEKGVIVNKMLSSSHRRAVTVKLSFDFPFYGHTVRNITIATGGFLYTGDYIHSWLAATQYIAPLMANFDTNISRDSNVKYRDNGTSFTIEWDHVSLQDRQDVGPFSFQATLHKNGDIVFVYREVPILIESIEDRLHPVKVGLSDAYVIDRIVFFIRRKTIYEYHRVDFKGEDIKNWTVIYMTALPTCHSLKDCDSCLNHETTFDCKWCPAVNRCSMGYDRMRHEWQNENCEDISYKKGETCPTTDYHKITGVVPRKRLEEVKDEPQVATVVSRGKEMDDTKFGHTGMMGLVLFVLAITGIGLWVLYAYRNPHTQSGQVLIRYRPSQWGLRRGEARYTAASIHM